MAPETKPHDVDDEDYASSEDSDFAPDAVPAEPPSDSEASDESEEEAQTHPSTYRQKSKTRKRKHDTQEEAEDVGFENSGDEEIIKRETKKKKTRRKNGGQSDEDGEGGFVKTRRMAALATEEKRPLVSTEKATVDVDALWAEMLASSKSNEPSSAPGTESGRLDKDGADILMADAPQPQDYDSDMISIQRTYKFAGKVHTESKLVPRNSAEAKLYLDSQAHKSEAPQADSSKTFVKRPLVKAKRSMFEPTVEAFPPRTDLHFGVRKAVDESVRLTGKAAKKLNTVEKSKMDWAGFVDKEGIKDELATAGKAKGAYLGQQEFLARVEEMKEDEARRARLRAMG